MRSWYDFYRSGGLTEELVREKPIIAICGPFQVGKSTMLNCLLGRFAALTGKGLATTTLTARYRRGERCRFRYRTHSGALAETSIEQICRRDFSERVAKNYGFHIEANVPATLLERCEIVDTPGFNACDADTAMTMSILDEVHYVLFVAPNRGFTQAEKAFLLELKQKNIPMSILMNCVIGRREERWIPEHPINRTILQANEAWLQAQGIDVHPILGQRIYPCNFLFDWSQQADFAAAMDYTDRADTVQRHIHELLREEGYSDTAKEIRRLSGVPSLLEWLNRKIEGYDPITHEWRNENE